MTRSKREAQERSAELRAVLGAKPHQRTVEAARALVAERDRLRQQLADTGKALADVWSRVPARDEVADAN